MAKKVCAKACAKPAEPKKPETITKACFIDAIADGAKITKAQAKEAYDAFLALVYKGAKAEAGVLVPGLGKFVTGERAARTGRNPHTGAVIKIKKAKVLKFRVAKAAKDAVLGKK